MTNNPEAQRVLRIESSKVAVAGMFVLAAGGGSLGVVAYNSVYNSLSPEHVAQLQSAESAASTVLDQYGNATSSLPEACRLVLQDAMKGSLDNPLDIITAANKSGTCQGNMDEITTVTYQYHDKMLQAEKEVKVAYSAVWTDRNTAAGAAAAAGILGCVAGWSLGFGLAEGIPIGRRKVKDEGAQAAIAQNVTNVPEITAGDSEVQPVTSAQTPEEPNKYLVGHRHYAHEEDMK